MDFLNKLSDTITEAGAAASEKAKEVSEVTKLKLKIRKSEAVAQEAYAKIGQSVYKSIKTEKELEDFAEEMKKIDDAKADIKLCKEYIRSIKGVDVCPSCGEDVEEDSAFCRHCGAKMEANE